jgi:hypothetical protein
MLPARSLSSARIGAGLDIPGKRSDHKLEGVAMKKLKLFLLLGLGLGAYLWQVRPRVLNWGASEAEAAWPMAGDEIVPDARLQTTRAVTVDAPPRLVWPWLVQMGPRPRAGAYTYDWIERLLGIDIRSADRILPELQSLEPGQFLGLSEKGEGLEVKRVEPQQSLVLQWIPARSTWAFGLYPSSTNGTRLVSRNRLPGKGPLFWLGMVGFMEWASLAMERKMLLGIKERAEKLAAESAASSA